MESPRRKNIRLTDYDYSCNGAYFITICIKDRKNILWNVGARIARPGEPMPLTQYGYIVETAIQNIENIYPSVRVDKHVIMPNHIHMIIGITSPSENETEPGRALRAPTISTVVCQMKGFVTKQIGFSIWQKLFYEHVIRNEQDYLDIWQYIDSNPVKWLEDEYFV